MNRHVMYLTPGRKPGETRCSLAIGIIGVHLSTPALHRLASRDLGLEILHRRRRDLVLQAEQDGAPGVCGRFLLERIGPDDGLPLGAGADEELEVAAESFLHALLELRLNLGG